ncbi:MAG TPA: N-acetyltransferase [Deltaproteobacteria bacterium]|nr:N-acetyltransferase [Deltaproteobacteria bacterium]
MIRKAAVQDIKTVHELLHEYGKREELLARPLSELYDHVRDFSLFVGDNQKAILGCCALQFCWEDLAEIRSLAVHPDHLGKKIGTALTSAALSEAREFNIKKVFTLTYKPAFFKNFGFIEINRSELPLKIWSDCIICVKFPDCDEIAMMKEMES